VQLKMDRTLKHNIAVNVTDGAFFGFGLGVASYMTVIPLFVATLTESPILIGLVSAMHEIGWYLPQLLTADHVARLRRYKVMVLMMTLHERLPFYAMALLALLAPTIGREVALVIMMILVIWGSMGGGLTATAWQSMIGKIMPVNYRGTFYGIQSSAANLTGAGGAVLAGLLLKSLESPQNFAVCFFICGVAMTISWGFLAWTREHDSPISEQSSADAAAASDETAAEQASRRRAALRDNLMRILRTDGNFRWFLVARMLAIFASMGLYFYSIFTVRRFGIDEAQVGAMTGVLMLFTVVANPLLGWLGDRTSHRVMYAVAVLMAGLSGGLAVIAPSANWMYVGFGLLGIAKAGLWTIPLPLTAEFGKESDRPYYIGLANTLIAPAAVAAPIIGGSLASGANFDAAFMLALFAGIAAVLVLLFVVKEPRRHQTDVIAPVIHAGALGGD